MMDDEEFRDIEAIRREHYATAITSLPDTPTPVSPWCRTDSQPWPCDTARLLDALDAAEAEKQHLLANGPDYYEALLSGAEADAKALAEENARMRPVVEAAVAWRACITDAAVTCDASCENRLDEAVERWGELTDPPEAVNVWEDHIRD